MLRGIEYRRRRQYPPSRIGNRRSRLAVSLSFFALLAATITAGALAFEDYTSLTIYVNYQLVAPGQSKSSVGFNTRTDNSACRENAWGWDGVYYRNTAGDILGVSGNVWTNCNSGAWAVVYSPNGYYTAYCFNGGVEYHTMTCEAWNYSA